MKANAIPFGASIWHHIQNQLFAHHSVPFGASIIIFRTNCLPICLLVPPPAYPEPAVCPSNGQTAGSGYDGGGTKRDTFAFIDGSCFINPCPCEARAAIFTEQYQRVHLKQPVERRGSSSLDKLLAILIVHV